MPEDYSSFSWQAIEKSMRDMIEDAKKRTGASDEEIGLALAVCANKFMDINFFELGNQCPKQS